MRMMEGWKLLLDLQSCRFAPNRFGTLLWLMFSALERVARRVVGLAASAIVATLQRVLERLCSVE